MIIDLFQNKCNISELTEDHIWPTSENGMNDKKNVILICKNSNQLKGDKTNGIEINNIKFGVLKLQTKDNQYIGKIRMNKKTIPSDVLNSYYDRFKLIEQKGKDYITIDTEIYNRYIERMKKIS